MVYTAKGLGALRVRGRSADWDGEGDVDWAAAPERLALPQLLPLLSAGLNAPSPTGRRAANAACAHLAAGLGPAALHALIAAEAPGLAPGDADELFAAGGTACFLFKLALDAPREVPH